MTKPSLQYISSTDERMNTCLEHGDPSKNNNRLRKRRCRKYFSIAFIPAVISLITFFYTSSLFHRSLPPNGAQRYSLLEHTQLSPDSCRLHFSLPQGSSTLRSDISIPTCIKVTMPGGTDVYGNGNPTSTNDLSKSYSPISHPSTLNTFDLVVKAYPQRNGGGVGSFLCSLRPTKSLDQGSSFGDVDASTVPTSIVASLKSPRMMHGSPNLYKRWRHVGLIAGGTGIAPLFQIATMLLDDTSGYTTDVHLLSINRRREDILLREELESLVKSSRGRFRVTYSLTDPSNNDGEVEHGRGTTGMIQKALPSPAGADGSTMILICGKDGFVDWWAGPIARGPPKPDGSKGSKVQGPLLGLLARAGYDATEVFKY